MPDKPSRRTLKLDTLDDVVADVEHLHASGYRKTGRWDLAQTCGHLAEWLRYPLDGFPPSPAPVRLILWAMRKTVGPGQLRKLLATGSMPAGGPTIPQSVPAAGEDEAAAVARLRAAVERFQAHAGPLHPSPLFGRLDHATATKLQVIHCAHHLSFLVPT